MQTQNATRTVKYKTRPPSRKSQYKTVSPKRPCRICGKPDWCSYTVDDGLHTPEFPFEEISFCARKTAGADSISRKSGRGVYFHTNNRQSSTPPTNYRKRPKVSRGPQIKLAPLNIRDAVYRELIRLSPANNYRRELVEAHKALFWRGFTEEDVTRFGSLPATKEDRARLARQLRSFVLENFSSYAESLSLCALVGIPGCWQDATGAVQLWMNHDEPGPLLVIPYRDLDGRIQACQVKRTGKLPDGLKPYSWLSTPKLRNGISSGTPIHHTYGRGQATKDTPILITEGALKAEAFVKLRPQALVVATSGVTCAHEELVKSTRGHKVFIGFDADHRENPAVCRQLGRLIAARERDSKARDLQTETRIIIWESTLGKEDKGIDDAARLGIQMRTVNILDWHASLTGEPKDEVDITWKDCGYVPS